MNDITIIIPVHKYNADIKEMLTKAFESVRQNQENYTNGKLIPLVIAPDEVLEALGGDFGNKEFYKECRNDSEKTDFCSQINFAVKKGVDTDYFSILEFDDIYTENWFEMARKYFITNESVSVFLPINIFTIGGSNEYMFANDIVWSYTFTKDLGYIDFNVLQDYAGFNLTGGIFNTKDFKSVGGLKSNIKVAFNYEFLLRLTKKELKVFVVPKEGYIHTLNREDNLTDTYNKTLSGKEIEKWYQLAKTEYIYNEDRDVDISNIKEEKLT